MPTSDATLGELAELVGARLAGEPDEVITGVATLRSAGPRQIAFYADERHRQALGRTRAAAVILRKRDAEMCPTGALITDNPYHAYAVVAQRLHPSRRRAAGIHPSSNVAADADIEPTVSVGANASIGSGVRIGAGTQIGAGVIIEDGAFIGPGCTLHAGVFVGWGCRLRRNVELHPGAVIGSDGFGFAPGGGIWQKIPQIGAVRLGDNVEIGANSTIDRGTLDDTLIGEGVKIDNQVHVGHNVIIGAHTAIAGGTVVAGSVRIGRACMIGGASAITGHIEIADEVTVLGMSGVTHSIRESGVYGSPIPAHPARQWRRNAVRFLHLDEMHQRIQTLERLLEARSVSEDKTL